MSIIVGLHGLPRTGKDTLAAHLVEKYGFVRVAFADALYQEVSECFEVPVEQLQSDEWKSSPQDALMTWKAKDPEYRRTMKALGYDLFEPQTSRFHLQRFSTEYRRAKDDMYWIRRAAYRLARIEDHTPIVVSDVRFYPESGMLAQHAASTDRQYTLIEIVREGTVASNHSSDQRLDDAISTTIINKHGEPELLFIAAAAHIRLVNGGTL